MTEKVQWGQPIAPQRQKVHVCDTQLIFRYTNWTVISSCKGQSPHWGQMYYCLNRRWSLNHSRVSFFFSLYLTFCRKQKAQPAPGCFIVGVLWRTRWLPVLSKVNLCDFSPSECIMKLLWPEHHLWYSSPRLYLPTIRTVTHACPFLSLISLGDLVLFKRCFSFYHFFFCLWGMIWSLLLSV